MRRISRLDTRVANQIAAGEVVERPGSVVKELLENSLDASAERIEIELVGGGKQLIRIKDDGTGIHPDDLVLAISPHATSKLQAIDDLNTLSSMGFRGEALASISSVSRFQLWSRQHKATHGWKAQVGESDTDIKVLAHACTPGTTIEVKDLFYNTPARRRFLRTDKTELNHIEETIKRFALSAFHINIQLHHNGKLLKRFRAVASEAQEALRISDVFGKEFVRNSFRLSSAVGDYEITGWLANGQCHRSSSDHQYFFVNQRVVRDRVLSHAVREALENYVPVGRFPCYALYLTVPAHAVDINIHPAKQEVRFRQPRDVHDFIVHSLRQHILSDSPMTQSNLPHMAAAQSEPATLVRRVALPKTKVQKTVDESTQSYQPRTRPPMRLPSLNSRRPDVNSHEHDGSATGDVKHVEDRFFCTEFKGKVVIADGAGMMGAYLWQQWRDKKSDSKLSSKPFLKPPITSCHNNKILGARMESLALWGIDVLATDDSLRLLSVPILVEDWRFPVAVFWKQLLSKITDDETLEKTLQSFCKEAMMETCLLDPDFIAQQIAKLAATSDTDNTPYFDRWSIPLTAKRLTDWFNPDV